VISATAPTIAGKTSLYIGRPGSPGLNSVLGRSLMLRLARQPGDTKLRFSFRAVAVSSPGFSGMVRVGSEGGSTGMIGYPPSVTGTTETISINSSGAMATPIGTMEMALPNDATDTVLVTVVPNNFDCGPPFPSSGILIDDLRLE
jgi:hypothetical protein